MKTSATSARWARYSGGPHRSGITLIELLFVVMILAILGAMAFGGFAAAASQARVERTRVIIAKLDQLIMNKYESYRTRALPIKIPATYNGQPTPPVYAAQLRLYTLRELMRLEMPDRISDVCTQPELAADLAADGDLDVVTVSDNVLRATPLATPALTKNYRRRARQGIKGAWTTQHEGAECLYLIVAAMRDGEDSALDFFAPQEIGDVDGDGMNEMLDAFGEPIEFLRWAPGYSEAPGNDGVWGNPGDDPDVDTIPDNYTEAGWPLSDDFLPPPTMQTRNATKAPDPFDPLKIDPRWRDTDYTFDPFYLHPLIFSAGPDKGYDINAGDDGSGGPLIYATTTPANDPYVGIGARPLVGTPTDTNQNGVDEYADNITNHDFSEK